MTISFFLASFDFYSIIVVSLPFTAYQWSTVQPILFLCNRNMRAGAYEVLKFKIYYRLNPKK